MSGLKLRWSGSCSCVPRPLTDIRSTAPARRQQYRSCSYKGYFIDLFVRSSNTVAISMYSKLGYKVYRRVLKWV